jgi:hypothetical protein
VITLLAFRNTGYLRFINQSLVIKLSNSLKLLKKVIKMFKPSKISLAVMVLMATGFSQMSHAQSSGVAEVTITGSNLKRADKEGTSPI